MNMWNSSKKLAYPLLLTGMLEFRRDQRLGREVTELKDSGLKPAQNG